MINSVLSALNFKLQFFIKMETFLETILMLAWGATSIWCGQGNVGLCIVCVKGDDPRL